MFFPGSQILKFTWTSAESTPTSETNASGFGSLASMQQRSKVKSPPQQPGFPSRLLKESLKKSLKGAFGGKKLRKLDEKYDWKFKALFRFRFQISRMQRKNKESKANYNKGMHIN